MEFNQEQSDDIPDTWMCPDCGATKSDFDMIKVPRLCFHVVDRQILKIAIPLIFSNLSVPLVGLVDNAVLGHLSSPISRSAGLGAIIMSYILLVLAL